MRAFTVTVTDIWRCPKKSFLPEHYNDDGTCHCPTKGPAMTWSTDNRWSPGGSGQAPPDDALAAYSARWIDQGDIFPADVVPDRQGFAYNETLHRDWLIERLETSRAKELVVRWAYPRDTTEHLLDDGRLQMYVRRCGGYFYVDAWLPL